MTEDDTEEDHQNDDTSEPEPILGSQVAANSEQLDEEDGDVEVLSESDDE